MSNRVIVNILHSAGMFLLYDLRIIVFTLVFVGCRTSATDKFQRLVFIYHHQYSQLRDVTLTTVTVCVWLVFSLE